MVYGLEVGTLIEHLSAGSTLYDGTLWTVYNGQTISSSDWGNTFVVQENNLGASTGIYYVHFSSEGTMFVCRTRQLFRAVYPYTNFTPVMSMTTTASIVRDWGFTEDNDGVLFATEYANYKDATGTTVNIIYWYRSFDDGLTWTKHDNLHHTDDKHLHQLKVDPKTNTLYATTGDSKKLVFKSNDKGESWEEVIPTNYPTKDSRNIQYGGHTTIGFFETGEILWGTDWKPNNPENGANWNWYVKSVSDDPNSFVYEKMPKQYYGMYASMATDYKTGQAWASLKDEFNENDVNPALIYTRNKGATWETLISLPATGDLNGSNIISTSQGFVDTSPYIFWYISGYGAIRIPKSLQPEKLYSDVVLDARYYQNVDGKIYEIEVYTRNGRIEQTNVFVGH